jgi:hypothetical protein
MNPSAALRKPAALLMLAEGKHISVGVFESGNFVAEPPSQAGV